VVGENIKLVCGDIKYVFNFPKICPDPRDRETGLLKTKTREVLRWGVRARELHIEVEETGETGAATA
jgi:hypothetical protein